MISTLTWLTWGVVPIVVVITSIQVLEQEMDGVDGARIEKRMVWFERKRGRGYNFFMDRLF